MVDAVDGVEVCLDYDVDDPDSSLVWDTSKGTCQKVDGEKALAYSRMRKSDPTGDIGRAQRQRAVVSAVVSKAMSAQTLINPFRQDKLVDSGTKALTVDEDASALDLGQMALAFRSASNKGLTGAPPIESLDYEPGGIGAAVLLQDHRPGFLLQDALGQADVQGLRPALSPEPTPPPLRRDRSHSGSKSVVLRTEIGPLPARDRSASAPRSPENQFRPPASYQGRRAGPVRRSESQDQAKLLRLGSACQEVKDEVTMSSRSCSAFQFSTRPMRSASPMS